MEAISKSNFFFFLKKKKKRKFFYTRDKNKKKKKRLNKKHKAFSKNSYTKFFYSILLYTKTFSKHFKKEIVSKKALFS